jgi:uncharacterized protein (DUF2252 family)
LGVGLPYRWRDRREAGRALREVVPLSAQAEIGTDAPARDAVGFLEEQAQSRQDSLIAVRYGRMAESPFGFLRGAAAVMAFDLAPTPVTGLRVQACGDAHMRNFGKYASPDRQLVFSINDFDETLPGPWEWDVKRLGASIHVVGHQRGFSPARCHDAVVTAVRSYRERMAHYAQLPALDLWYERTSIEDVITHFPKKDRPRVERDARRAGRKDHRRAVAKYTRGEGDEVGFVDNPPLLIHIDELSFDRRDAQYVFDQYRASLPDDRRVLIDRYRVADVAHRVGGVGSVATACWIALLEASDQPHDRIILQVKEAQASVLERYVGASTLGHHGRRVVAGQRLCQGATDLFLGWCEGQSGTQYYVRQLWDAKGRSDIMTMNHRNFSYHGALCGWALARAHARSGDAAQIAGYLGKHNTFDDAIATYAAHYATTTQHDHAALLDAIAARRVHARTGI